ncbi:hypothetical protein Trydic_g20973 [Trypoxylus dichotomus]
MPDTTDSRKPQLDTIARTHKEDDERRATVKQVQIQLESFRVVYSDPGGEVFKCNCELEPMMMASDDDEGEG